jgi:hypothetical protein
MVKNKKTNETREKYLELSKRTKYLSTNSQKRNEMGKKRIKPYIRRDTADRVCSMFAPPITFTAVPSPKVVRFPAVPPPYNLISFSEMRGIRF